MSHIPLNLALAAAALTAAAGLASTPAIAEGMGKGMGKEKCYGVALKGKNHCGSGSTLSCAGSSTKDYQGAAWKYVAKGECIKMSGSLKPTADKTMAPEKDMSKKDAMAPKTKM